MAKKLAEIKLLKDEVQKCVRCGRCRGECPVFREKRTENVAPRGQVYIASMLRSGDVEPLEHLTENVYDCLMCESCTAVCPSGIHIHEFVGYTRAYLNDVYPSKFKKLIFQGFWTKPYLLRMTRSLLWLYDKWGIRDFLRFSGLINVLPADLPEAEKMLPDVPHKSARAMLSNVTTPKTAKKMRVGYFLGCAIDIIYPDMAKAAVDVLVRNGIEVVIPEGIVCCGRPHIANGQLDVVTELARKNIEAFADADIDYIVADCASCSSTLKEEEHYIEPFEGTPLEEKAKEFVGKIIDINVFLVDVLKISLEGLGKISDINVTYHDPCHLVKSQKVSTQPRKILQMIPGVTFTEMDEANKCCGGAGTYGLTHFTISQKILARKMENFRQTKADVLATCCPTCTLQLSYGLDKNGFNAKVLHPIQLLSASYAAGDKEMH